MKKLFLLFTLFIICLLAACGEKSSVAEEQKNVEEIEKSPSETEKTEETNKDSSSLNTEEGEIQEKEAAAYVDALIQATVFQNAEKYAEKAPGPESSEEKQKDGSTQKGFFKEIYKQNTKQNMTGLPVTDEQVDKLTDAFLKALSVTEYEVIEAKAQSADKVKVTVSVKGFDDNLVNNKTEAELTQFISENKVGKEELVAKSMEVLTKNYEEVKDTLEPVNVEVDVDHNPDGSYVVMFQDQYLKGFVR
ncbi:hypothetical protein [Metabacillus fastidiosus]|uniref:hypothetical protein n=1 Tax=Metabacillus fastidiosus TaxID=1458 RepID=UPI002E1FBCD3|nr:hypothetical protein [Metabacillus fastidiosus]